MSDARLLLAGLLYNRGTRLIDSNPTRAQRWLAASLAVKPDAWITWLNLGNALSNEGDLHAALGCHRRAMRLSPDNPQPMVNAGVAMIGLGQHDGWALYDARFALPTFREMNALRGGDADRVWTGQPLDGKTILVFDEQGYGDAIMGLRYARPLLDAGAAKVIMRVHGPLYQLAALSVFRHPAIQIITDEVRLPDHDFIVPFLSLPRHFGTGDGKPYLRTYPGEGYVWKTSGLKVGVVWGGSPHHLPDARRSIPIDTFAPIFDTPGVSFLSLQQGERAKEGEPYAASMRHIGGYYDTALHMQSLDLVITVDTSVAHLAGALGIPTWMLVAFNPDFRWGLEGGTTPWYSSMRIFRQTKRGDWPSVIQRVQSELATFVAQHRSAA